MPGSLGPIFIDRPKALAAATGLLCGAQHKPKYCLDFEQAEVILTSFLYFSEVDNELPAAVSHFVAVRQMASNGLLC